MKYLLVISLVLTEVLSLAAQKKYEISFPYDGYLREMIVSIPTTPPPSDGYPVVMMLHGSSGDKNIFYNSYGWKQLGQKENFITIFPSSLSWCFFDNGIQKNNTKWVCGELLEKICPSDTSKLISDIKFFRKILDVLKDTVSINPGKVFASGFSNGDAEVFKIAMEAGDVFKVVGGSAGELSTLDSLTPQNRVPIWYMVGTLDDRFVNPPYTSIPFGEDSVLNYLYPIHKRILACQGLSTDFTKTETPLTKTYLFQTCLPGQDCKPYVFTLIKNLTHQFPNGQNNPIDGPDLLWKFFNNPPGVITATDELSNPNAPTIACFPNPSRNSMKINLINFEGTSNIQIYSQLGTLLKNTQNVGESVIIDNKDIGTGIFFLKVNSKNNVIVKKIIFQ